MKVVRTIPELRTVLDQLSNRYKVGLVPTMGAFHDGHLSLFRAARAECGVVVVSLFVNPTQFGPNEDLARYPRDEQRDIELADQTGADVLFVPSTLEMYPEGFDSWVDVGGGGAEGSARPSHFRGVATVCVKLFNIVRPHVAYFGQKDARQAAVLRQVVRDLNMNVELRIVPTVRDADGLALSSRNAYLTSADRAQALALPRALHTARDAYLRGSDPIAVARQMLNGLEADYVELVDLDDAKVLAAAARVGDTRLIDNVILEGDLQ